jgi:drug/metabolite transporter (DMT)-like permease
MQECRITPPAEDGIAGPQDEAHYGRALIASAKATPSNESASVGSDAPVRFLVGAGWGLLAVSIWAGWFIVTRISVATTLTAYDLVALRYSVTLLILLPFIIRIRMRVAQVRLLDFVMVALGSGATFGLCVSAGVAFAPAAEGAALTPGVMPLITALLGALLLSEVLRARQLVGLAFTLCGVVAIAGLGLLEGGHHKWVGHLLFLSGAFLFALYTVGLRRSGLSGLEATAFVSVITCAWYLPVYIWMLHPHIFQVSASNLVFQTFYQGVAVNILSLIAFGRAVASLGASRAAVFAATVPALTLLLGMFILGEIPSVTDCLGIVAVTIGVLLASGAPLPSWLGIFNKWT